MSGDPKFSQIFAAGFITVLMATGSVHAAPGEQDLYKRYVTVADFLTACGVIEWEGEGADPPDKVEFFDTFDSGYCLGFITSALQLLQAMSARKGSEVCIPENTKPLELQGSLVDWYLLGDTEARAKAPTIVGIIAAASAAWPCQ